MPTLAHFQRLFLESNVVKSPNPDQINALAQFKANMLTPWMNSSWIAR